jgi:hypothetical protein
MNQLTNRSKLLYCTTPGFASTYTAIETGAYCVLVRELFFKHGYDMYIFSNPTEGKLIIEATGYNFMTGDTLQNKKTVYTTESLDIKTFWCKIDQQSKARFLATFLFPDEY